MKLRLLSSLRQLAHPVVRDERELTRFVLRTCAVSLGIALAVDVAHQLAFFAGWTEALRSWAVTVVLVLMIAFPVSRAVGRAYLAVTRSRAELEILSRTDELTGLLNRRALMQVAEASRMEMMVLVIADIDRFKGVNDSYGHLIGDKVIRMVSSLALAELGDLGHLGRIGGEEFALLGSAVDAGLLAVRLERLRMRISLNPVVVDGKSVHVTISAGVALSRPGEDFDQLFAEADRALYLAKAAGRNRITFAGAPPATVDRGAGSEAKRA